MDNPIDKDNSFCIEAQALAALSEIAGIATQKGGLHALFCKIVDVIARTLNVEVVSLMLPDKDDPDYLTIKAAKGLPPEVVERARVRVGSRVAGYVYATGEPLLIQDINEEASKRFGIKHESRYRANSLLTVPIRMKGRTLGVVNVNNKCSGRPFDESDLHMLNALMGYVALAIENAEQYLKLAEKHEELKHLTESLRTTMEHQMQLLMKLSHRIRSPLTGILGYAELLLNKTDSGLSESDRALLKKIVDRSWELAELAERIFEYESILHDDTELEPRKVALSPLLKGVANRYRQLALERGVDVEIDIQDDAAALIDPFYISKSLGEVVENAIRYTKTGGKVRIEFKVEGSRAKIRVSDDGPGLDPELSERIFYEFFQIPNTEDEIAERLGLGLSLAKTIIEKHSGTIGVEQTGPNGTTFLIELPCWQAEVADSYVQGSDEFQLSVE